VEEVSRTLADYYRRPNVKARVVEYCGGRGDGPVCLTALRIAGYGGRDRLHQPEGAPVLHDPADLDALLESGADVCRSLSDARGALLHLDVDYMNPEDPGEPYRRPLTCFAALEPVYQALEEAFARHGMRPMALMTGRGYHFTTLVPEATPFHRALVRIGTRSVGGAQTTAERAHEGVGRLLEHLAHGVMRRLAGGAGVPLTVADAPSFGGGPYICLDLSAYADPVCERYVRCAFSANQKAWMQALAPERPFALCLPRRDKSLDALLEARCAVEAVAALARSTDAMLPEASEDGGWVADYEASPLARFHALFDAGPSVPRELWPHTYDLLDTWGLPGCAAIPLESPNPLLLRPLHLRCLAWTLWGLGWHPRSIAGLVESRYARDHAWGTLWARYDRASRAAFYVRIFCGLLADGVEDLAPWTCELQRQHGACFPSRCPPAAQRLFLEGRTGLERKTGGGS
jgi:hypothetical protein